MLFSGAKSRVFVVSDRHDGAPYADSEDGWRVTYQGMQGYFVPALHGKKSWVQSPADFYLGLGDNPELINLPLKKQPETILKYSPYVDRHIHNQRKFVNDHPFCRRAVDVLGNHERTPEFDVAVDQLERDLGRDQYEVQRSHRRIANGLFMHGDQAINPKKYHVDENNINDYSNKDGRYNEPYTELFRAPFIQAFHDVGNRYLPWTVGRLILHPKKCASRIIDWALSHDARYPGEPSILDGVDHIFYAHTHDPQLDYKFSDPRIIDRQTGKPKVFSFHNTGGSIYIVGRINRDCFNALSVFLNSDSIDDPTARIVGIVPFKSPHGYWREPDSIDRHSPGPPTHELPSHRPSHDREGDRELEPAVARIGLVAHAASTVRPSLVRGESKLPSWNVSVSPLRSIASSALEL